MKLKCEIIANSDVEHLQQIYTGFSILHKKGFLALTQTIPEHENPADRWTDYEYFNTHVILNDKIKICYDTHDWNLIDEKILSDSDFYFKRSYDGQYISQLAGRAKVFPLGLNYCVASSDRDFFRLKRSGFHTGREKLKYITKSLKIAELFGNAGEIDQIRHLQAMPDYCAEPKIIFMARAYDPDRVEAKAQRAVIEKMNESRADCVRILQKEFGNKFFGGLARDDYTNKHFNDALLPVEDVSNKRKYLEILRDFPIAVATVGLNGSNGWKLGEYVALSKAIISEPLVFQVTGDFAKEKNYLEFSNPEELTEAASRLFENRLLRNQLMIENYRYYQAFLRPDSLILNSLSVVLEKANV